MKKANEENNFEARIKITNYVNKDIIKSKIDKYLQDNNYKTEYTFDEETKNLIVINFGGDTTLANCILRYLKILQLEKGEFNKMKVNLAIKIINSITISKSTAQTEMKEDNKSVKSKASLPFSMNNKRLMVKKKNSDNHLNTDVFLNKGPYKDSFDLYKEEVRKNKAKWINKNGFNQFPAKATSEMQKNSKGIFLSEKPVVNVMNYKFRDEAKNKWVGKNNFFV